MTRELTRCLRPLVDQLPPIYREAFTLTDLGSLTQSEAATRLRLSPSGMKSRVQRARRQLNDLLTICCTIHLDLRGGIVDYERVGPDCGPDCPAPSRAALPHGAIVKAATSGNRDATEASPTSLARSESVLPVAGRAPMPPGSAARSRSRRGPAAAPVNDLAIAQPGSGLAADLLQSLGASLETIERRPSQPTSVREASMTASDQWRQKSARRSPSSSTRSSTSR